MQNKKRTEYNKLWHRMGDYMQWSFAPVLTNSKYAKRTNRMHVKWGMAKSRKWNQDTNNNKMRYTDSLFFVFLSFSFRCRCDCIYTITLMVKCYRNQEQTLNGHLSGFHHETIFYHVTERFDTEYKNNTIEHWSFGLYKCEI